MKITHRGTVRIWGAALSLLGLALAEGCAGSPSGSAVAPEISRTCTGAAGPLASCPIAVTGTYCDQSDAKSCVVLAAEEVAVGKDGACLRLVYRNRCDRVIYGETSIEYQSATRDRLTWQNWTSTVWPGSDIDVSQCGATGRYRQIATFGSSASTLVDAQCPLPR